MLSTSRGGGTVKRTGDETARLYASLLSRPLDPKDLTRPTFKCIQEVVQGLIIETKILRKVFNPSDFDNGNKLWDKRKKEEFVQKLIDFVANNKQPVVGCVAAKIVSGVEPNKTNELLQSLAKIALAHVDGKIEGSNLDRPRTFTKQLPVTASQSKSSPVSTRARTGAAPNDEWKQPAMGLSRTKRSTPVRATIAAPARKDSTKPRGTSGQTLAQGKETDGTKPIKTSAPQKLSNLPSRKSSSENKELKTIVGDKTSRSSDGSIVCEAKDRQLSCESCAQSRVRIISESDVDKHLQQLRSSLKVLSPVLVDVGKFASELEKRLSDCREHQGGALEIRSSEKND